MNSLTKTLERKMGGLAIPQIAALFCATRTTWIIGLIQSIYTRFLLWCFGAKVGASLRVSGRLRIMSRGGLSIGNNVRINSGPARNYVGADRRTNIWVGRNAELIIESGAAISNSTIIACKRVHIKEGCFIGGGCDIYDTDFHELMPQDRDQRSGNIGMVPVEIGPRAFVGAHTIVLKGVTIGEGAVIGAGSLVTKSVPPFEIWAGRPATFIRELSHPSQTYL